jgi:hypothetical protein
MTAVLTPDERKIIPDELDRCRTPAAALTVLAAQRWAQGLRWSEVAELHRAAGASASDTWLRALLSHLLLERDKRLNSGEQVDDVDARIRALWSQLPIPTESPSWGGGRLLPDGVVDPLCLTEAVARLVRPGTQREAWFPVELQDGSNAGVVRVQLGIIDDVPRRSDDNVVGPRVFLSPTSIYELESTMLNTVWRVFAAVLATDGTWPGFDFLIELEVASTLEESYRVITITDSSLLLTLVLCARTAMDHFFLKPIVLTGVVSPDGSLPKTGDKKTIQRKVRAVRKAMTDADSKANALSVNEATARFGGWKRGLGIHPEFFLPAENIQELDLEENDGLRLISLPKSLRELLDDRWIYFTDGFDALRAKYKQNLVTWGGLQEIANKHGKDYVDFFEKQLEAAFSSNGGPTESPYHSIPIYVGDTPKDFAQKALVDIAKKLQVSEEARSPQDLPVVMPVSADDGPEDIAEAIEKGLELLGLADVSIGSPFAHDVDARRRETFLRRLFSEEPEKLILVVFGPRTPPVSEIQNKLDGAKISPWYPGCVEVLLRDIRASFDGSRKVVSGVVFIASDAHHDEWIRSLWEGKVDAVSGETAPSVADSETGVP